MEGFVLKKVALALGALLIIWTVVSGYVFSSTVAWGTPSDSELIQELERELDLYAQTIATGDDAGYLTYAQDSGEKRRWAASFKSDEGEYAENLKKIFGKYQEGYASGGLKLPVIELIDFERATNFPSPALRVNLEGQWGTAYSPDELYVTFWHRDGAWRVKNIGGVLGNNTVIGSGWIEMTCNPELDRCPPALNEVQQQNVFYRIWERIAS